MLINDTSLLTKETRERLEQTGIMHIHTGGQLLTEETALELLKWFDENQHIFEQE